MYIVLSQHWKKVEQTFSIIIPICIFWFFSEKMTTQYYESFKEKSDNCVPCNQIVEGHLWVNSIHWCDVTNVTPWYEGISRSDRHGESRASLCSSMLSNFFFFHFLPTVWLITIKIDNFHIQRDLPEGSTVIPSFAWRVWSFTSRLSIASILLQWKWSGVPLLLGLFIFFSYMEVCKIPIEPFFTRTTNSV